ncbi:hypothetical protein MPNTM1_04555 [Mycolicibacterium parafortuitum]
MSAQADDIFALAHLDLANEANGLLTTLRYRDLTGADLAGLVAILRAVNERRLAREAGPAAVLKLVPRKQRKR